MNIKGTPYRSIWVPEESSNTHANPPASVRIIDQRQLPHRFVVEDLQTKEDVFRAIRDMHLRGAPLIGAAAAYGMWLAALQQARDGGRPSAEGLLRDADDLAEARPTAVNLAWALERQKAVLREAEASGADPSVLPERLLAEAIAIADEDVAMNHAIGQQGLGLIKAMHTLNPERPVQILTHCNAGWLATVDWGTATSPMYQAHDAGIPVHVWVDETRPRNQGAQLTAWELGQHGVPHTLIVDNAGGHLMQHGQVDMVITGTDRTTRTGDVCNKIGTYLKALAAKDNGVPFYVALPSPTIDWEVRDGLTEIPIEERGEAEVRVVPGWKDDADAAAEVRICPPETRAANPAFDVTPSRLVTGLITERGVCDPSEAGLVGLFPEHDAATV